MTDTDSDNKQEQEYEKTTISLSDGTTFDFVDNRTREQRLADLKKRVQKWREENPEQAAANRLRVKNRRKYRDAGIYTQPLPKDYLHQQSYEQRLALAEQLNGCEFKESPPYTSKRWHLIERNVIDDNDGFFNLCDGKMATMGRLNGFVTLLYILQLHCVLVGPLMLIIGPAWVGPLLWLAAFGMVYLHRIVKPYDQFVFNRHTGLVKTPHNWWRRSFYIPYEDLECYDGGVIKSARGGGARSTAKFRCMKTPKRYYLKTPEFIARFGGVDQVCWAAYLEFMDIRKPVNPRLHKSIEHYFTLDKNVLETGPFPEEIKQYLDADDKQVNREHVW